MPGSPILSVTGKPRREVALPSQEGKKGAMQYALYVQITQEYIGTGIEIVDYV